jgi:hypothetical protein
MVVGVIYASLKHAVGQKDNEEIIRRLNPSPVSLHLPQLVD